MSNNIYTSPFTNRYGTDSMRELYSDHFRHKIWRELWQALACAENYAGAKVITDDHCTEIYEATKHPIDYDMVKKFEDKTHHDVVAHLLEFGTHCPTAQNILHLGATSCYITDNADILIMRGALYYIDSMLHSIRIKLDTMANRYKSTPIVGRTHLQKAQLTTVGKRICMWLNDIDMDCDMIDYVIHHLKLLGCKGATGSQSSLYTLFDGDYSKAELVDEFIGNRFNMSVMKISGQTYTRKYDSMVANILSQIAQSTSKFATDIRLMASFGEMYEKFGEGQVGSSAMPYKRNPITCEKICGISRYVICNAQNTAITASTQWLERTLDDSSNKRIVMAELFLATSEILQSMEKVIDTMVINEEICMAHAEEHAKMASLEDDIIIKVKNGGNRQDNHRDAIWSEGSDNAHINTGFAEQQVTNYLNKGECYK